MATASVVIGTGGARSIRLFQDSGFAWSPVFFFFAARRGLDFTYRSGITVSFSTGTAKTVSLENREKKRRCAWHRVRCEDTVVAAAALGLHDHPIRPRKNKGPAEYFCARNRQWTCVCRYTSALRVLPGSPETVCYATRRDPRLQGRNYDRHKLNGQDDQTYSAQ